MSVHVELPSREVVTVLNNTDPNDPTKDFSFEAYQGTMLYHLTILSLKYLKGHTIQLEMREV